MGTAERSGRIRTYRYQEKIVVDHRLTGDNRSFPLFAVLDGELDGIVQALTQQRQQALLLEQNKEER